jgi:hypothetical protein
MDVLHVIPELTAQKMGARYATLALVDIIIILRQQQHANHAFEVHIAIQTALLHVFFVLLEPTATLMQGPLVLNATLERLTQIEGV